MTSVTLPASDAITPKSVAIETVGLSKQYGDTLALVDVTLKVEHGRIFALCGTNGAGKTTLMRLLLNLEAPTAGSARVCHLDTQCEGPRVRAHVGYMLEPGPARPGTTGQHLMTQAAAYFIRWDQDYAGRLCRAIDLDPGRPMASLSAGVRRRWQLVLALAHRPPLLLLDEPTDKLDPVARQAAWTLLAEHLADTPTTVLMATHHVHETERLIDDVGILRSGRLVHQGERDALGAVVARYRVELPAEWTPPATLDAAGLVRPVTTQSRVQQWTLVGQRKQLVSHFTASGARVCDITAVPLDEAVHALLTTEALE